jgi:hypothetical protein
MTGRRFAQILVASTALALLAAGGCTNVILALSDYTLCGVGGAPGCGGGGAGDDGGSDGPSTDGRTAR